MNAYPPPQVRADHLQPWQRMVAVLGTPESADKLKTLAREFQAAQNPAATRAIRAVIDQTLEATEPPADQTGIPPERAALFTECRQAWENADAISKAILDDIPEVISASDSEPETLDADWHACCFYALAAVPAVDWHRRAQEQAVLDGDFELATAHYDALWRMAEDASRGVDLAEKLVDSDHWTRRRRRQRERLLARAQEAKTQMNRDYGSAKNGHRADLEIRLEGSLGEALEDFPDLARSLGDLMRDIAAHSPQEIVVHAYSITGDDGARSRESTITAKIVEYAGVLYGSAVHDPFPKGYPAHMAQEALAELPDEDRMYEIARSGYEREAEAIYGLAMHRPLVAMGLHDSAPSEMRELGQRLTTTTGGDHYGFIGALLALTEGDHETALLLASRSGYKTLEVFLPEHIEGLAKAAQEMGMSPTGIALLRAHLMNETDDPGDAIPTAKPVSAAAARAALDALEQAGAAPDVVATLSDFLRYEETKRQEESTARPQGRRRPRRRGSNHPTRQ